MQSEITVTSFGIGIRLRVEWGMVPYRPATASDPEEGGGIDVEKVEACTLDDAKKDIKWVEVTAELDDIEWMKIDEELEQIYKCEQEKAAIDRAGE